MSEGIVIFMDQEGVVQTALTYGLLVTSVIRHTVKKQCLDKATTVVSHSLSSACQALS